MLVRARGPDAGQTGGLAGVRQVEDAVRGGAVGGLLVNHGAGGVEGGGVLAVVSLRLNMGSSRVEPL